MASKPVQAALTLAWTATALVLMVWAARSACARCGSRARAARGRRRQAVRRRPRGAVRACPRIAAFLGVGVMLLAIGYFAPPPPSRPDDADAACVIGAGPRRCTSAGARRRFSRGARNPRAA
jgi:hypothetical protein